MIQSAIGSEGLYHSFLYFFLVVLINQAFIVFQCWPNNEKNKHYNHLTYTPKTIGLRSSTRLANCGRNKSNDYNQPEEHFHASLTSLGVFLTFQ